MNTKLLALLLAVSMMIFSTGFDKSRHNIPLDEIHSGGPPKDGIPALLKPKFIAAAEAETEHLKDSDRVLGLFLNGQAKAYPIKILNWHEIVNDRVGGQAVVISFCPLCGTGMVFDATIKGRQMTFGVSGLLYQSDVLLYDHQTESLWSQIKSQAVTGKMTDTRLVLLPSSYTTWGAWRKKHPDSLILSTDTGYRRNYYRDPYEGYYTSPDIMFSVNNRSNLYHPKERVVGIEIGGKTKAYPFSELAKSKPMVKDTVGGVPVNIFYDNSSQTAVIRDRAGKELPSVVGFWFAWYSFHPDTEVFKGGRS
ncbi:MAG: DUF3179 domain-containing protein [Nitrospinales bacterium]